MEVDLEKYLADIDLNHMIDIMDNEGNILYANHMFCELTGYSLEDLVGNSYDVINSKFHPFSFFRDMWEVIRKGIIWQNEIKIKNKYGQSYWTKTKVIPITCPTSGSNCYITSRTIITESKSERYEKELIIELCDAIKNEQLVIFYQKIVDSKMKTIGYEALVRWMHPSRGLIYPNVFIELAEENNLIHEIGLFILNNVFMKIKEWETQNETSKLILSINVSPKQISENNFVEEIIKAISKYGIDAAKVHLEITEKIGYDSIDVINKIKELMSHNINFSLDDFGMGTASINMLRKYPFSTIKIDRSFVENIENNQKELLILESLILLAEKINVSVIIEGIENEFQFLLLNRYKNIYFQGFFFGRPEPLD